MKVHLNQIPDHGLEVAGEEPSDFLDPVGQHFRALSPVSYALDVGVSEGGLFATGTLAVDVELACVSCGETFVYPLRVDSFALQTDLTTGETVDLTPYLREDILLALPLYPHCDWDGRRTCPAAHFRDAVPLTEPPPPSRDAWGELDKLKGL